MFPRSLYYCFSEVSPPSASEPTFASSCAPAARPLHSARMVRRKGLPRCRFCGILRLEAMGMKRIAAALFSVLVCLSAAGCRPAVSEAGASSVLSDSTANGASVPEASGSHASSATASSSPCSAPVREETDLFDMTLEQKVGQMFFLAFRKDNAGNNILSLTGEAAETVRSIQPGGFVLFGENIGTVEQVRGLIRQVQDACAVPPFISVDQEGGDVQRIRHTELIPATDLPSMWEVGSTGNLSLARETGDVLGSELGVFGFNMDFAPVCDVFSNPLNKVIGTRSFSSDPSAAAAFSCALSEGLRSEGIIPVCKHFPGHGDTSADTHEGYAAVNKTLEELRQTELVPFRAQIAAGAEAVMVAHISLPLINGDETPATLSPKVIQGILRGELGFQGVVITDSLSMGAVVQHYTPGEAAVLAVKAGADLLLMPEDPAAARDAVLAAVKSGEISVSRIDESVQRILTLKKKYNLWNPAAPGEESLLGCAEHLRVAAGIKASEGKLQ